MRAAWGVLLILGCADASSVEQAIPRVEEATEAPVRPRTAPPSSDEGMSRADAEIFRHVGSVMKRNIGQIKGCYERALAEQPDFAGDFELSFTLQRDGTTREAAVSGDGLNPGFERCVVAKASGWTFGELSKEAPVRYPLHLRPEG